MTSPPIRQPVRILGIDPGLRRTGWGVIEVDGNRLVFIGCGSVEPPYDLPLASRLLAIHEGLAAVLGDFRPAEAAVEQTFVNKDGVATLKLGQARGVAMLDAAIEAGADDVVSSENGHEIYASQETFREVAKALEAKFGEARKAALTWKPQNTVAVDDETGEKLLKLMDLLNEHDDVQNVYANFGISDALVAKMGG